jgi:hypothetical protein
MAERLRLAQERIACQQQAAKDHPQGGLELVKAIVACNQAK